MSNTVSVPMPFSLQMNYRYCLLAACMMHVEGFYSTESKAFRNHNPGNIEVRGKPGVMMVYDTALHGYVDLVKDIYLNAGTTLRRFIAKYAPPTENDDSMYLGEVSTLSGIGKDDIL